MGSLKQKDSSYDGLKNWILKKMVISETDADTLVQAHILKLRAERKLQQAQAKLSPELQNEFSKTIEDGDVQEEVRRVLHNIEIEEQYTLTEKPVPPKFLTVREVSNYKGITMQQVRRNCISGKYKAEQVAGEHSSWRIWADQFEEENRFDDFLQEREQQFQRTAKAAKLAQEMWVEELEEEKEDQ
ncbi:hypothetical protein [Saccharibacillus qingshengii]|uniref:hypothetical protein n=1 Tax=Saccharibacillus qingshengii TaxID=1763540 RepID=UPI0015554A79|nr:hypothetical protein [Saccharibacillus qingshengii]